MSGGDSDRANCLWLVAIPTVIASDSEAIQTKPQPQSPSLDRVALLATTTEMIRVEINMLQNATAATLCAVDLLESFFFRLSEPVKDCRPLRGGPKGRP